MALKHLTPLQFLTRVAFKTKMTDLCNDQFVIVHDDEEKFDNELLKDDDGDGDGKAAAGKSDSQENLCNICLLERCTVLFLHCRHLKACTPCYQSLLKKKKDEYKLLIAEWYPDEDNELLDEKPGFAIQCVYCRKDHEEKDVIYNIFN